MKKITLQSDKKQEFIDYARSRISRCNHVKSYNHLTNNILNNSFDFFVKNRLTVENNGKSYWYRSNKKEWLSYGYSGHSKGELDDSEAMTNNLYHEIFCQAEWIGRSKKEGYEDICKGYIGYKAYNSITA